MAFSVISNFIFNIKTHDKSHWDLEKTGKSYIVRVLPLSFCVGKTLYEITLLNLIVFFDYVILFFDSIIKKHTLFYITRSQNYGR